VQLGTYTIIPANTANPIAISLIVVVRVAVVEIDVPGIGIIVGVGSRRPVVVGSNVLSLFIL
jgi:hypothetical protein